MPEPRADVTTEVSCHFALDISLSIDLAFQVAVASQHPLASESLQVVLDGRRLDDVDELAGETGGRTTSSVPARDASS